MKTSTGIITAIAMATAACGTASAQYYELANQLANVVQPALSGSFRYKGFVTASYIKNLGDFDADYLEFSTSQGFQYATWFYMGAGLGVDVLFSHPDDDWGNNWSGNNTNRPFHRSVTTAVMMPLFTDFRFNIGKPEATNFFIDLRIGCSFLLTDSWVKINNGYLTDQQYFYLKPTVGIRIPVNPNNKRQAFNVGVSYQLLTSNYWHSYDTNGTLSGLGVSASYEW